MFIKPSTAMADLKPLFKNKIVRVSLPVLMGVLLAVVISIFNSDDWLKLDMQLQKMNVETKFNEAPIYVGSLDLSDENELNPYALCSTEENYFVSYLNRALVDVFDERFRYVKRLDLSHQGKGSITGIDADKEYIYVADSQTGDIRIYDYSGNLIQRLAWLPDNQTRLRPQSLALFDGVLYVTDRKLQKVMAINIMEKPGISEPGELIFSVPNKTSPELEFFAPGFCTISPDGRLLVSTVSPPNIRVFTCSGRDMGLLIEPDVNDLKSPQGMAFDEIPSPELLARNDSIFDPSGTYELGRIHIADREAGLIHIYDSFGKPVTTYGAELHSPINMVIDNKKRLIVISDMADSQLKFYKY